MSSWADKLIEIYFKNRPADITQKLYKKNGLRPFEYWYYELSYINSNYRLIIVIINSLFLLIKNELYVIYNLLF